MMTQPRRSSLAAVVSGKGKVGRQVQGRRRVKLPDSMDATDLTSRESTRLRPGRPSGGNQLNRSQSSLQAMLRRAVSRLGESGQMQGSTRVYSCTAVPQELNAEPVADYRNA